MSCENCKLINATKLCSKCIKTRYCSKKCQTQDWDRHKLYCCLYIYMKPNFNDNLYDQPLYNMSPKSSMYIKQTKLYLGKQYEYNKIDAHVNTDTYIEYLNENDAMITITKQHVLNYIAQHYEHYRIIFETQSYNEYAYSVDIISTDRLSRFNITCIRQENGDTIIIVK